MTRGTRQLRLAASIALATGGVAGVACAVATSRSLQPLPGSLDVGASEAQRPQFVDRHGQPLTITYQNSWNLTDRVPIEQLPPLLLRAFVTAEDRRFYQHHGVDWPARLHAALQNLIARRAVRGASTISEQAVRLLHPRPRTIWSRWLEGFEAAELERRFPKSAILEFYLDQVPYAHQRRGVAQAARFYFDRDLDTLDVKEQLALAVLVRAPARLDPVRHPDRAERAIGRLAAQLREDGALTAEEHAHVVTEPLQLARPYFDVDAAHFVQQVEAQHPTPQRGRVVTTLDRTLQRALQQILDERIRAFAGRATDDGAVLVIDHQTNQVLAWVNGGGFDIDRPGSQIDAVLTPRQPGSTLKPLLYALALEHGFTAATLIDDSPLAQSVGAGMHSYRNYSGQYHGPLRLREALGNSLNIPAVRTVDAIGRERFLQRLRELGFGSLEESADHYGDGLALGNGEVSLFELVRAYAVLARGGIAAPIASVLDAAPAPARRVVSAEASSIISDILSDANARRLEFGRGHLLRFSTQTAVKTGTSTDYRDAWAVGYSSRYTAGVWLGNLDQTPMREVSGSVGCALVLRAVFNELNRGQETRPLALSPRLESAPICLISGHRAGPECPTATEYFAPGSAPAATCQLDHQHGERPAPAPTGAAVGAVSSARFAQPTAGLQLAMDPRIPDARESFVFKLDDQIQPARTEWLVDGEVVSRTGRGVAHYPWPLRRGAHRAQARVWLDQDTKAIATDTIAFVVK